MGVWRLNPVCCSVLQFDAVCRLDLDAVRCSVLQCVAQGVDVLHRTTSKSMSALQCVAVCCSALQCVAVCCSVLQ